MTHGPLKAGWSRPYFAHEGTAVKGSCAVWQDAFGTWRGTAHRHDPFPFARAMGPFVSIDEAVDAVEAKVAAEVGS
jgi:hypothetical protein